jgi:hypothetical protein
MGDLTKDVPSDIEIRFCGWKIKHGHHLGTDPRGRTLFSCNGYFERVDLIDPSEVGNRYA